MNPVHLFFFLYIVLFGGALCYLMFFQSRQDNEWGIDPFTDELPRPPGESLRMKIVAMEESFSNYLVTLLLGVASASVAPLLNVPFSVQIVVFIFGLSGVIYSVIKMARIRKPLMNYRLGYRGELVVGQSLNSLIAAGYDVYHDIVFKTPQAEFNIDHVVLGPSGVFAIETKTRRKPKHLKGKTKATVVFDGTHLAFPTFTDTHGIEQAVRNAKTLSKELSQSSGECVTAQPVLTLPGWFVDRKGNGELLVVNPKELTSAIKGKRILEDSQIQRIRHQLYQRSTCS